MADGHALSATLARQRLAQDALVEAATRADTLAEAHYRAGRDSQLVRLDAQRGLYQARQRLIAVRAAEQANRVASYRALGGGWNQLALVRADIHLDRPVDLADELLSCFDAPAASDPRRMNPALVLELSAEASRDPQIADTVRRFDADLRKELVDWLLRRSIARGVAPMDAEAARRRALMLQMTFEAVIVRAARDPGIDRALLGEALRQFVGMILDEPAMPDGTRDAD